MSATTAAPATTTGPADSTPTRDEQWDDEDCDWSWTDEHGRDMTPGRDLHTYLEDWYR